MRAVYFDPDGTILHCSRDYREILADAVRDVTGHAPGAVLDSYDEAFYGFFGDFEPRPVERAFEAVQRDAEPEALADALLEREIEAGRPPVGAAEDLARPGERFRLGVLTNGVGRWQSAKLRAHGLAACFDAFVASYEAGEHKPAAAPFRLAERRLPRGRLRAGRGRRRRRPGGARRGLDGLPVRRRRVRGPAGRARLGVTAAGGVGFGGRRTIRMP